MAEPRTTSRIGELLVGSGALTEEQLQTALERQSRSPLRLGELLVEEGLVDLGAVRAALHDQHGLEAVDLGGSPPENAALERVPAALIRQIDVLPLAIRGSVLRVAAADPDDQTAMARIRAASGHDVLEVAVVPAAQLHRWIRDHLRAPQAPEPPLPAAIRAAGEAPEPATCAPEVAAERLGVLLGEALRRGATDLHLVPGSRTGRVEARIDGALIPLATLPARLVRGMVTHLAETAAGGTVMATSEETTARFQLTTLPTTAGDRAMLRRQGVAARTLDSLQLADGAREALSRRLETAHGLYLVVGPRASGRTTAALAMARQAGGERRHALVVTRRAGEDLPGALISRAAEGEPITARVDAAVAQDPDILVIDAPDDPEALRRGAAAAMEGHLVIATVSGARAASGPLDAIGAGVPRYLVAATLQASLACRLARAVCGECAVGFDLTDLERQELTIPAEAARQATFRRGRGCTACWGTGYDGRLGLHETLLATPAIRAALRDGTTAPDLVREAREAGFRTLWEDGLVKTMKGLTTPEELRTTL